MQDMAGQWDTYLVPQNVFLVNVVFCLKTFVMHSRSVPSKRRHNNRHLLTYLLKSFLSMYVLLL